MNRRQVEAAVVEAERFLDAAKALLATEVRAWNDGVWSTTAWKGGSDAPKQSGAVRRASMDLTRSLAEMRRP